VDVSRSAVHQLLYLEGERFLAERFVVQRLLAPGMRVADIGANIGYYLLLIEQVIGPRGRVLCVEPEPDNLEDLRRVIAANSFQNVEIVSAALGAENTEMQLSRGLNGRVVPSGGDLKVPLMRLDDLWDRAMRDRVDFLKIDVEGFEGEVLAGGEHIISEHRPRIFLELHPTMMQGSHTVASVYDTLLSWYGTPDRIEFFEVPQGGTGSKIWAQYFDTDPVKRLRTRDILAACEARERQTTFWAVCR
jgi:FkbM family methyltransferase